MYQMKISRKINVRSVLFFGAVFLLILREVFYRCDCHCNESHGTSEKPKAKAQPRDKNSHQRYIFDATSQLNFPIGEDNTTHGNRYLIYRCDELTMRKCGGWADRIYGALAAYMLANLTGRVFKMEILLEECDITRFVQPNRVDWHLPQSFHKKVVDGKKDAKIMLKLDKRKVFLTDVREDYLKMPEMKWKYIYIKINGDYTSHFQASKRYKKQLAWMSDLYPSDLNAALYKRLFKPTPYLLKKVTTFLSENLQRNEKLVCAHVRMGQNPNIPDDTDVRMREEFLPSVWRVLEKESKNTRSKIFLMSDSDNVIDLAKSLSFGNKFFFTPGESTILHLDKAKEASPDTRCKGLEQLLFEQLVLMHCDSLLISASGLSRMAAFIRETDEGLYCLFQNGHVQPCKRKELTILYKDIM